MSNYTAENMGRFLGNESNDSEAEKLAAHLTANGWSLQILEGENEYRAFVEEDGEWREITEGEWQEALATCFG